MTYSPVPVVGFGGLDLVNDPQEVAAAGAIDALNVDLSKPGRVSTRPGNADFTTSSAAERYYGLHSFITEAGTSYLLASRPTKVEAIDSTGAVAYSQTTTSSGTFTGHAFVSFGTPAVQRVYFQTFGDSLRYFDSGGTFGTAGGSPPTAYIVARQPIDNRLVLGNMTSLTSRVRFSDAGDPDTWGANNYVDLSPGDGESLRAIVSWRELMFVFKPTKFFVFYGNSQDSAGEPVFNYREVNSGQGVESGAVCVADDAVYFVNRRGVWRTTGGVPELISRPLDPMFTGMGALDNLAWAGGSIASSPAFAITAIDQRLYVAMTTTIGARLVFEYANGVWSPWSLDMHVPVAHRTGTRKELHYSYLAGNNRIGRVSSSLTTNGGAAISWNYRTGFFPLGEPGSEGVMRGWSLEGVGSVNVKTAVNDAATLGTSASVTLGTSPAVGQGQDRRAVRGRNVSVELSGSGVASVSKLVGNARAQRATGLKSA